MDARTNAIHELFAAAVALPPAERAAMIDHACADDSEMRRQVVSLLDAHDRAGRFLADPAFLSRQSFTADPISPGTQIGPYTLQKVIGEGGYGTVYLAEQQQPIARRVALKIIKAGMDTRQVIARFELERQALAVMEHPHIARVFDAGSTESGRPYFVMELIEGHTITEYCRTGVLDLPARLGLFGDVCDAVQHAHHKGVIHRDIKPSNVLVTVRDGKPVVKVIDFGIAKALDGSAAAGAAFVTEQPQLLGTPQSMSPEQAAIPPIDVDTRTDVYSLGVLLYELLTDAVPFDPAMLRSAAYAEVRRVIREIDPPTPSNRLITLGTTIPPTESSRTGEIRRRIHEVRGELDWVVMKAMEKDRQRRYATVAALGEDISRFLRDEPVSAGRPGRWHRLKRFTRRHRQALVMTGIVAGSLIIGLIAATDGFIKARRERDGAIKARLAEAEQRAAAQASAAKARADADRLWAARSYLFRLLAPTSDGHIPPPAMLDYVMRKVDSGELKDNPEIEEPIRAALGNAYVRLQLYPKAEHNYRASLKLYQALEKGDSLAVASALNNLATAIDGVDGNPKAEPFYRDSVAMYRRVNHGDTVVDAPALINLAILCANAGRLDESETLFRSGIALMEKAYGAEDSVVIEAKRHLADLLATKAGKPAPATGASPGQASGSSQTPRPP